MVGELMCASRGHFMAPCQEAANRLIDIVVRRPVSHQSRAVAKIASPTTQQMVQPQTYFVPGSDGSGRQNVRHPPLETLHALLRRARAEIPVAILPVTVRAKAVA